MDARALPRVVHDVGVPCGIALAVRPCRGCRPRLAIEVAVGGGGDLGRTTGSLHRRCVRVAPAGRGEYWSCLAFLSLTYPSPPPRCVYSAVPGRDGATT